jgi:flagellar FliL protein
MAAKPEAAPAKDAKDAAKDAAPGADAAAPAAKPMAALIPVIAVVVLAPVLSFAVGQFVLIPQLKKQVAAMPAGEEGAAEAHAEPAAEAGGHGGGEKKGEAASAGPGNTYQMENIVVNLAGTMGTRYLKTSFMVTGSDKNLRATFESNKPKLVDITLNVLSSLSLADLEEAGAKNIIREKLMISYNQALGRRVVEQIYFADFVVQ